MVDGLKGSRVVSTTVINERNRMVCVKDTEEVHDAVTTAVIRARKAEDCVEHMEVVSAVSIKAVTKERNEMGIVTCTVEFVLAV